MERDRVCQSSLDGFRTSVVDVTSDALQSRVQFVLRAGRATVLVMRRSLRFCCRGSQQKIELTSIVGDVPITKMEAVGVGNLCG